MKEDKQFPGRTKAVNLFCRNCNGWDGSKIGTPYSKAGMDVRECGSRECHLYFFRNGSDERPGRKKKGSD